MQLKQAKRLDSTNTEILVREYEKVTASMELPHQKILPQIN